MKKILLILPLLFLSPLLWAQRPEIVVQTGHSGLCTGMAFSKNGKYLCTTAMDHLTILWDVKTGRQFRTISTGYQGMANVAFAGSDDLIAGLSEQDTLKIWNVVTGAVEHALPPGGLGMTYCLDVSPDGKKVATGAVGLAIADVASSKEEKMVRTTYLVQCIKFSPDGKYIATSGVTPDNVLYDAATLTEVRKFSGLPMVASASKSLEFSADGKYIAASSNDEIMIWEVATGNKYKSFKVPGVYSFSLDPSFRHIAVSTLAQAGMGIRVIDIASGKDVYKFENRLGRMLYNPAGTLLASAEFTQGAFSVNLLSASNGNLVHLLKGSYFGIQTVAIPPSQNQIAVGGLIARNDSPAKLWDLSRGTVKDIQMSGRPLVKEIEFSPDGSSMAIARYDSSVSYHDAITLAQTKRSNKIHTHWVQTLAMTKSNPWLVTGSWDNSVKITHRESGKVIQHIKGFKSWVNSVAVDPSEKYVAVGTIDGVNVYEVGQEAPTKQVEAIAAPVLSFSDAGNLFAAGDGLGVRIYSFPDMTLKHHLDKPAEITSGLRDWHYMSVAFNHKGTLLAGGTMKGDVKLWNTDGSLKCVLKGHSGHVNAVAWTPDDKYVVSGSEDATVKIWDAAKCQLVATLISIDSANFVIVTPDNYFMATRDGLGSVAFRIGDKVYPFEQFDLQYNRPDTVLDRLGYADEELRDAYYAAYKKRLQKMNFDEKRFNNDFHLPTIKLLNTDIPSVTTQGTFALKVNASDSKYKLDRINVYVNGVPIYGRAGIDLRGATASSVDREIPVELASGANKIQVSVLNDKGAESLLETMQISYSGGKAKPDLFLLSIGVSDYVDDRFDLNYAAKDAEDLCKMFESQQTTFGKVHVRKILNKDATADAIKAARSFLDSAGVDDMVIVFVSGHGLLDTKLDYYFGVSNISFDNPAESGLAYGELENLLDRIKARKKILIMDTCHSGEVDKESMEASAPGKSEEGDVVFRAAGAGVRKKEGFGLDNSLDLMKFMFADLQKGIGATVISSAGGAEYALEGSEWNNGVFTYAVLMGLAKGKADQNKDKTVTITELRTFVREEVSRLTGGRQVPTYRSENLASDYKLWGN